MFGVATEGGTILKQVCIINRRWSEGGCQDKAVVDINRSMFFEAVMRLVIFDNPVRGHIASILFRARPVTNYDVLRLHIA